MGNCLSLPFETQRRSKKLKPFSYKREMRGHRKTTVPGRAIGSSSVSTAHVCAQSCPTLCYPMDCIPERLLCPWDFPGQNTGVGCYFLLYGIFLTQDSRNPTFLSCTGRQILYHWASCEAHTSFNSTHNENKNCLLFPSIPSKIL